MRPVTGATAATIAALLLLAGLSWLWLWGASTPVRATGPGEGDAMVGTARDEATLSGDAGHTPPPDETVERVAPAMRQVLTVRVVDREGRLLPAVLTVARFPGRAAPLVDLSPQRALLRRQQWRDAGVEEVAAEVGECRLESLEACGIALYVRAKGRRGARLVRIAPFVGQRTETVLLDGATCHLDVLVYDSDLRRPAVATVIECIDEHGQVRTSAATDARGEVAFDLDPDAYMVRVAGADPNDREARAHVPFAREAGATWFAVLAVPEPRCDVALTVQAKFERAPGRSYGLGLLRIDGAREQITPVFQALVPGANHKDLCLQAGTWRPIVLPQGGLVPEGDAFFGVGAGAAAKVQLVLAAGGSTRLCLRGLESRELPVRVRFFDAGDLDETVASQAFVGPLTWHQLVGAVGPWGEGARLLVHKKNRSWLGRLPAFAADGEVAVDLVAATTLLVSFADGRAPAAGDGNPVVAIAHRDGVSPRTMHRRLLDQGLGFSPGWYAFDVVPNGPVRIAVSTAAGSPLGERVVEATGGVLEVGL